MDTIDGFANAISLAATTVLYGSRVPGCQDWLMDTVDGFAIAIRLTATTPRRSCLVPGISGLAGEVLTHDLNQACQE
jgi:hypothetical protein